MRLTRAEGSLLGRGRGGLAELAPEEPGREEAIPHATDAGVTRVDHVVPATAVDSGIDRTERMEVEPDLPLRAEPGRRAERTTAERLFAEVVHAGAGDEVDVETKVPCVDEHRTGLGGVLGKTVATEPLNSDLVVIAEVELDAGEDLLAIDEDDVVPGERRSHHPGADEADLDSGALDHDGVGVLRVALDHRGDRHNRSRNVHDRRSNHDGDRRRRQLELRAEEAHLLLQLRDPGIDGRHGRLRRGGGLGGGGLRRGLLGGRDGLAFLGTLGRERIALGLEILDLALLTRERVERGRVDVGGKRRRRDQDENEGNKALAEHGHSRVIWSETARRMP